MSTRIGPIIWCNKADSMYDYPIHIVISNLKPNCYYTLYAFTKIDNGNRFESYAQYVSDDKGCIDLKKEKSIGGNFLGIEPMGLLWSMKPSPLNEDRYARLIKINVNTSLIITLCVFDGIISSIHKIHKIGFKSTKLISQKNINRWMMAPGTQRISLSMEKDGIYGTIFIPNGKGPFPGIITLFGSYRGTLEYKAALLASYGFATLALSFIGLPGLPEVDFGTSLQLEYFEKATQVLLSHPKVDKNAGIGLIGLSFSSFIVLMMSSFFPCIKCVIWLNGFHYPMYASITYKDKIFLPQAFLGDADGSKVLDSMLLVVSRSMYPKLTDPFDKSLDISRIPFYNRHDVGYMFIAGLSDNSVPSEYYINQIEKLLKASKHPNYQLLRYPGAGHLLEPCYGIHHRITQHKMFHCLMEWGGESIPHCKAQEDSWKKQLAFLKSNLLRKQHSHL